MKKPSKPRKPKTCRHMIGEIGWFTNCYYTQTSFVDLEKKLLKQAAKFLKVPVNKLDIVDCSFYRKEAWWILDDLDEKVLIKATPQVRQFQADYKKKYARYLKKLRQYEINHPVWEAWDLKSKKEKLEDEMHLIQKKLDALDGTQCPRKSRLQKS